MALGHINGAKRAKIMTKQGAKIPSHPESPFTTLSTSRALLACKLMMPPHTFGHFFALFVPLRRPNTETLLSKYKFCIFYLHTYPGNPFMKLQHFKIITGLKFDDFVFLTPIWPLILPFFHYKYDLTPKYGSKCTISAFLY